MAYDFDGSNDGISLGNGANLNPASFTASAWVLQDTNTVDQWVIARDGTDVEGRSFAFGIRSLFSGTTPIIAMQINGANSYTGATTLTSGVLRHIAGTHTGGTQVGYVNGVSDATGTVAGDAVSSTAETMIGHRSRPGENNFYDGTISEVGFWNVVLTVSEIVSLSKGYSPLLIRPASLLAYVPLVRSLINYKGSATLVDTPTAGFAHSRIIMARQRGAIMRPAAVGGLDIPIAYHHYRTMHAA